MTLARMGRLAAATLLAGLLAGLGAVGFHYIADRLDEILFAWAEAQHVARGCLSFW